MKQSAQVCFLVATVLSFSMAFADFTHVWKGGEGNFSNAEMWLDAGGKPTGTAPGADSRVSIPKGAVTVDKGCSVAELSVSGGTLTWSCKARTGTLTVSGDAVISGGALTHKSIYGKEFADFGRVDLAVGGDLTVAAGAAIHGDGMGYYGDLTIQQGPGAQTTGWGGGTHGGMAVKGVSYGSIRAPLAYGSSGVGGRGGTRACGGGSVRLAVGGTLTVDGRISADGMVSLNGGGAGGSVWISAGAVKGKGLVSASGRRQSQGWDEGSGGRVAIVETKAKTSTSVRVAVRGCASGTVYYENASDDKGVGTLVIGDTHGDANGAFGALVNAAICDGKPEFRAVRLGAFARLHIASGFELKVREGLVSAPTALVAGDVNGVACRGGVALVGPAPATISGSNTFSRLTCAVPGKTVRFGSEPGDCCVIADDGAFSVTGDEAAPVALLPSREGGRWRLALGKRADVQVSGARLAGSVASAKVTAFGSKDAGGNSNWTFVKGIKPGDAIVWTGAAGSDWTAIANWRDCNGSARLPVATDVVTIPAGAKAMPTLGKGSYRFGRLVVETGATLTLAGAGVQILDALTVAGQVKASGGAVVELCGFLDLTKAESVELGDTLLILTGDADQTLATGGRALPTVRSAKIRGNLKFPDGLKADAFVAAGWGQTFSFGAGTALESPCIAVWGATLCGLKDGAAWTAKPTGVAVFAGVTVRDSTGEGAAADGASVDAGGNNGWRFDAKGAIFTGLLGNDFFVGSNWTSGAMPDAETTVAIVPGFGADPYANAEVVLRGDVTVANLVIVRNATVRQNGHKLTVKGVTKNAGGVIQK